MEKKLPKYYYFNSNRVNFTNNTSGMLTFLLP